MGLALLYPMLVLLLAWGLLVAFVLQLLPRLIGAFESFRIRVPIGAREAAGLADSVLLWAPVVPALAAMVVLGWWWSGRAQALRVGRALRWVPWLRGILADWKASNFARWLALLIEHGVPLPEAVELATEATGDPALREAGSRIAEAARRGEPVPVALGGNLDAMPPLLRWIVVTGRQQGGLGPALQHAAETYRLRALRQADILRTALPTLMLLAIGATAATVYVLALFLPWTNLLDSLARPNA